MKPLVYYCRWQGASLRLRGREEELVWGHLVFRDEAQNETLQAFRFYLKTQQLVLVDGDEETKIQLDEMGVVQQDG
jgi:hypothetical protein